jgi:hypothetical protein
MVAGWMSMFSIGHQPDGFLGCDMAKSTLAKVDPQLARETFHVQGRDHNSQILHRSNWDMPSPAHRMRLMGRLYQDTALFQQ